MQKTTTYLKATLLAITLVLGSAYVSAWTAPVSDPPGGSVSLPVNTGNTDQNKTGGLGVGNLNSVGDVLVANGVIKPGSFDGTVTVCGSAGQPSAGSMRYNSTAKALEYCDGSKWTSVGSGTSGVKICLENENCSGTPILCGAKAPDDSETMASTASNPIIFSSWKNDQCKTSGTGWHTSISSCGLGGGNGYNKCSWVLMANNADPSGYVVADATVVGTMGRPTMCLMKADGKSWITGVTTWSGSRWGVSDLAATSDFVPCSKVAWWVGK